MQGSLTHDTQWGRQNILEMAYVFLLSSYKALLPSSVSLYRQAVSNTQREKRLGERKRMCDVIAEVRWKLEENKR